MMWFTGVYKSTKLWHMQKNLSKVISSIFPVIYNIVLINKYK